MAVKNYPALSDSKPPLPNKCIQFWAEEAIEIVPYIKGGLKSESAG